MADSLAVLSRHVHGLGLAAKVLRASSLNSATDLVALAEEVAPQGSVLATCRNGVYRSSMAASALSAAGLNVVSKGTHAGLSYEFTDGQLQQATPGDGGGIKLPSFESPINLLILCAHGESQDELREVSGVLSRLSDFLNDCEVHQFGVIALEGPEEDHVYY